MVVDTIEPLSYDDFLSDVNIEYGNQNYSIKQTFKLKQLPYLFINQDNNQQQQQQQELPKLILDVTQTSCAFLGNSDYVEKNYFKNRRVILEIISAKLSTNFVNYTLLIKTIPGLDKNPTVIERRFSDFSMLYYGLKSYDKYLKFIDGCVCFPKKVVLGNFSLANIAERSIEFSRLLNLCMKNVELLWSAPFISFLLDKELKEAHMNSLSGDPDDVQSLLETVYHIGFKVYMNFYLQTSSISASSRESSFSLSANEGSNSPVSQTSINVDTNQLKTDDDTSSSNSNQLTMSVSFSTPTPSNLASSTQIQLPSCPDDNNQDVKYPYCPEKICPTAFNKRILITFSLLFFTYHRGENYDQLRKTFQVFSQLISSDRFINYLKSDKYYSILKACISFLLEINGDNFIFDESQKFWLTQKQTHFESIRSDPRCLLNSSIILRNDPLIPSTSQGNSTNSSVQSSDGHISPTRTGRDLVYLISDRNFSSFQDGKFTL